MKKKVLSLNADGKLVLIGSNGKVENFSRKRNAFAFMVIDCSQSMSGHNMSQAKKGAIEFAENAIKKGYAVGLIKFDFTAQLVCEPAADTNILRQQVGGLIADGPTNMADGIKCATEWLHHRDGDRVIVLVTDGMPFVDDTPDDTNTLNAAQQAKDKGIEIITIGTDDANKDFLNKIASRSELSAIVSRDQLGQSIVSAAKLLPGPCE